VKVGDGSSYQVKSWAIQWEDRRSERPDKIWIVYSELEDGIAGLANAYYSPETVRTIIERLEAAKAAKQEVWFWTGNGRDVLLINLGNAPVFVPE
jgi:hypothetical protein